MYALKGGQRLKEILINQKEVPSPCNFYHMVLCKLLGMGINMSEMIYVTEHAILRYIQRKRKGTRENAIKKIIQGVKRSRIIAMDEDGKETREHRGLLFICKKEGNILTVITVMFSEIALRFAG